MYFCTEFYSIKFNRRKKNPAAVVLFFYGPIVAGRIFLGGFSAAVNFSAEAATFGGWPGSR